MDRVDRIVGASLLVIGILGLVVGFYVVAMPL
jgi:hypothetical protein